MRALLTTTALLLATLTAVAALPTGSAACANPSGVDCTEAVGPCDVHLGANVVTATAAGASADCSQGFTRCYVGAGVGANLLDPSVERWCAF